MSVNTLLPSLSRSKRFSINWSGTVTPVKNYQYFFSFDEENHNRQNRPSEK
jgi:hypothetical protein